MRKQARARANTQPNEHTYRNSDRYSHQTTPRTREPQEATGLFRHCPAHFSASLRDERRAPMPAPPQPPRPLLPTAPARQSLQRLQTCDSCRFHEQSHLFPTAREYPCCYFLGHIGPSQHHARGIISAKSAQYNRTLSSQGVACDGALVRSCHSVAIALLTAKSKSNRR